MMMMMMMMIIIIHHIIIIIIQIISIIMLTMLIINNRQSLPHNWRKNTWSLDALGGPDAMEQAFRDGQGLGFFAAGFLGYCLSKTSIYTL